MSARTILPLAALALVAAAAVRCAAPDVVAYPVEPDTIASTADSAAKTSQPGALATVPAVTVHGADFEVARRTREVPGSHARRFGTRTLGIGLRTRTPDLTQYPCTSCHLGRALVPGRERAADAHQDVPGAHPADAGGCMVCHARADVEQLGLRSGEQVTMDHAYRLCAQCHFSQAGDWAAGAHGKRLDGWQGRRVVMGCTDCHDPHQPALQQRVPFRAPILNPDRSRKP